MLAIFKVTEPRFQGGRIVLADRLPVCHDIGFTRNGGPLTGGVDKCNVDFRIGIQVVSFAGLGVGVEKKVDASALLGK